MDTSHESVVGRHISEVPEAIEDVWPAIDADGVVTALLRSWDDADYVRLDAAGQPVDEIARTHHLMPRRMYQATRLPADWRIIGTRLLARAGSRPLVPGLAGDDALGSRREYEMLEKMNAGYGLVIEAVDTSPPFTHIYEIDGDFYLVEMLPDPQAEADTAAEAQGLAGAEAAAEAQRVAAPAEPQPAPEAAPASGDRPAPAAAAPSTGSSSAPVGPASADPVPAAAGGSDPDLSAASPADFAAAIAAASAAEAQAAGPRGSGDDDFAYVVPEADDGYGEPESRTAKVELADVIASPDLDDGQTPSRASLDAVVAPEGAAALVDDQKSSLASRDLLSASVDESMWDEGVDASDAKALLKAQATPSAASVASAREESFAKATEFLSKEQPEPDPAMGPQPVLTLAQVRKTGRFAWDEFMNLYLPNVGFVAAMPDKPGPDGKPQFRYLERPEHALRPVGWHHLVGCDCEVCRPGRRH